MAFVASPSPHQSSREDHEIDRLIAKIALDVAKSHNKDISMVEKIAANRSNHPPGEQVEMEGSLNKNIKFVGYGDGPLSLLGKSGEAQKCVGADHSSVSEITCDDYLKNKNFATYYPPKTVPSMLKKRTPTVVKFGKIVVREYGIILGDNPGGCLGGPSLAIGWEYTQLPPIRVNKFEQIRLRRSGGESSLIMPKEEREETVRRLGYSESEIAQSVRQANKIRSLRKQSFDNPSSAELTTKMHKAANKLFKLWKR